MKINKYVTATLLAGVVFASGAFLFPRYADAIAITVKRVTFEGSKRAEVITIINNSDSEETYRLGFKNMIMTEKNGIKDVSDDNLPPEIRPAQDMVRFSPLRFTLPPRGSQQVRMMLRMPASTPDGEYRSHLWVRTEQNAGAFKDQNTQNLGRKAGVSMQMLPGVSMPVIVRKGNLDVKSEVVDLSASNQTTKMLVNFTLLREGTKSTYGDIDFICNKGGADEYLLKFIKGFSVYQEINRRFVSVTMPLLPEKPTCNLMTVRYTETDGLSGGPVGVYGEADVSVN